jgi:hypothetical protein
MSLNATKSSRVISHVNAELKTKVSETGSVSINRVDPDWPKASLQNVSF